MTTGVILATTPADDGSGPTALLHADGRPALARLATQLRAAGVDRIVVVTAAAWRGAIEQGCAPVGDVTVREADGIADACRIIAEIAGDAPGGVVVAQGDIVAHDGAVRGLLADPRVANGVLTRAGSPEGRDGWALRVRRGRILSAESPFHATGGATTTYLGMLRTDAPGAGALAEAARSAGALQGTPALAAERAGKASRWAEQRVIREAIGPLAPMPRAAEAFDTSSVGDDIRAKHAAEAARRAARADDADALVLTALVRGGVTMRCSYIRELHWARPASPEEAHAAMDAMAAVNEERVLMNSAVKAKDGFTTTFFFSPYTKHLARLSAKVGLRPNQVTGISLLLGAASAAAFAYGHRAGLVAGAVLLWAAFATDCVDGQLARYARDFSTLGAWLDPMADRTKEYMVFAGLAAGAVRQGADHRLLWILACAAIAFQTIRHLMDFAFAAGQHQVIEALPKRPLDDPDDGWVPELIPERPDDDVGGGWDQTGEPSVGAGVRGLAAGVVLASGRAERIGALRWMKRIIVLPIGERYLVIAIGAAAGGARVAFYALLGWGLVAAAYSGAGRILRSAVRSA